jgi:hypothetical protein
VLNARNQCLGAQLRGEDCDTDEMNARVEAARTGASAQIQQACSSTDLQTLRYVDLSDATRDVINVCRDLDTSATSAAYGPAMFGGTIAAVDGTKQVCLGSSAREASRLLRFARARASARSTRSPPYRWSLPSRRPSTAAPA